MYSDITTLGEWLISQLSRAPLVKACGAWLVSHRRVVSLTFAGAAMAYSMSRTPIARRYVNKPTRKFGGNDPDVIIIGSGVGGSALATVLARDGRKVTIVERNMKEPDRVVGELMQSAGVRALKQMGLGDVFCDIDAHAIDGLIVNSLAAQKRISLPYPTTEFEVDGKKESISSGISFHNGRFVMSLRKKALNEPNVTCIEGYACNLIEEENGIVVGVQYQSKGDDEMKEIYAPLTFAMDGLFSKFRKEVISKSPETHSHFTGILLTDYPEPKPNFMEYILDKSHIIVVYQISSTSTRCSVDIRGPLPKNMKKYLMESLYPRLPDYLKNHFKSGLADATTRVMPNRFLSVTPKEKPGFVLLGDSYNIRHPLMGGGMSVCLNDVLLWRGLLRSLPDLTDYESVMKALESFLVQRKLKHSLVINIMGQFVYEVFAASDENLITFQMAMLDYLELGGECLAGPMSLVAGIKSSPFTLLRHFLSIAAIAAYRAFRQDAGWAVHRKFYRTGKVMAAGFGVMLPLLWGEIKTVI